jgi:hypothetical protein
MRIYDKIKTGSENENFLRMVTATISNAPKMGIQCRGIIPRVINHD